MHDRAISALVQWAENLKGEELKKLPKDVMEAVIFERERMDKCQMEARRDYDIIKRFPENSTFIDHLGRKCTVEKQVIDRYGYSVDAMVEGVGMGNFHSSVLPKRTI